MDNPFEDLDSSVTNSVQVFSSIGVNTQDQSLNSSHLEIAANISGYETPKRETFENKIDSEDEILQDSTIVRGKTWKKLRPFAMKEGFEKYTWFVSQVLKTK